MSAIAGILSLNEESVTASMLANMTAALLHRGIDGHGQWQERSIGFVHCMLHTTPESKDECLPLDDGDMIITADARIDNRDDLQKQFRFDTSHSDSRLVLEAYRRWGVACVDYLIGDFAFAIWDRAKQQLFAARDPLGVKPFHYCYHARNWFAFASEYGALLRLPFVARQINELSIANYLLRHAQDCETTFYEDIWRLAPGHFLIASNVGLRLHRYWSPDLDYELTYASDEVYVDHFREVFTEAVRCRLRSQFPVGILMSGGLDSTSVACVARTLVQSDQEQILPTFSAIFPSVPKSDERYFIDQVVAQGGLQPHFFRADQVGTLPDPTRMLQRQEVPFATPNLFLTWELCRCAANNGLRVMLDGVDGDTAVSHGFGYLTELALQRRWDAFDAEIKDLVQNWEQISDGSYFYRTYGFPVLTRHARRMQWGAFLDAASQLSAISSVNRTRLVKEYGLKPFVPDVMRSFWASLHGYRYPLHAILNPAFARRISGYLQQREREARDGRDIRHDRDAHARQLLSGMIATALETRDRTAAAFHIELRHPFFDKRLVEYCLALPGTQKLRHGWSRLILRQAMAGMLPPAIEQRRGKANLGFNFVQVFLENERDLVENMLAHPDAIAPYVNMPFFKSVCRNVLSCSNSTPTDVMLVWLVVVLNAWLKQET